MDTAWIGAFSAVIGSLVGGLTSFLTTYTNQRAQYRRDLLRRCSPVKAETLGSLSRNANTLDMRKPHNRNPKPTLVGSATAN
jgi:hypothetical protein